MTSQEEQLLVEKAKTEEEAFCQLYEYYLPRIYGYISKRVGRSADAEDLTSQTFLKVVAHLPRFSGLCFKSWLYRIATNTIIDFFRTRRPTEDIEQHSDIPEISLNPSSEFAYKQEREQIFAMLKKLPEKYQTALNLRFYADLSNQEIALSLGITENNVAVLIHRALKNFQQLYNTLNLKS